MITVIDKSGRKSTVARDLVRHWIGLGAIGKRDLVHGRAPRPTVGGTATACRLARGSRAHGVHVRPIGSCYTTSPRTAGSCCPETPFGSTLPVRRPGEASERDLGWLMASFANGLSSDGRTLIFADGLSGRTPAGNATVFRRSTDGSPAVSLGEARRSGRVVARRPMGARPQLEGNLILLPAGAGSTVTLPKGEVVQFGRGAWLRDSKRIVFTGDPGDGKPRGYIQEIPAGLPRAITPVGVSLAGRAAVRDDNSVLGRVGATWTLFPIHGGDAQPVPALKAGDIPVQWSHDGRYVYTVDNVGDVRSPAVDVFRVELTTGARVLWKTLTPPDPVGVEGMRATVVITPDARSYCYSYMRRLGDLFVVDGLK